MHTAQENETRAENEAQKAAAERTRAVEALKVARRQEYSATMLLAQNASENGDVAWLHDLLDAVASASPHLARGDTARFLTDVALKTQSGSEDAPEAKPMPDKKAKETAAKPAKSPHPSGERANKRQSAIAENLKKWLSARKSGD